MYKISEEELENDLVLGRKCLVAHKKDNSQISHDNYIMHKIRKEERAAKKLQRKNKWKAYKGPGATRKRS